MAILSALDLFGIQPGLTIDNVSKFKSVQGFLITVLAISITIAAALSPVKNWLYRQSPLIVQETKLNKESSFIGGKTNPIYFGIRCMDISKFSNLSNLGATNIEQLQIPPPKVTQIVLVNGNTVQNQINLDRCDKGINLLGFSLVDQLYCLNDEIELYDKDNGETSSRLLIQYDRPAFRDILYGNPLSSCGISIIYQNTYLDASNYDNFIQFDVSSEELMVKPEPELIFQTLTFKKQTYRKKQPLFSGSPYDERIYSALDRSYVRASVKPPILFEKIVPIMVFTFEFSKKEEIFNLKYFEFQDLISTIGGTFGLIISLLRVFSGELNKFPMKAKIMNSIFKFYKVKEAEPQKKISIQLQNKNTNETELQKRTTFLKDALTNKSKERIPDKIDIFDLYKLKAKVVCKRKLSNREEFIQSMEEFVINSSNIESMSKISYIVTQLSNLLIGPTFSKYVGPPELNLENENMDFFKQNKEIIFKNEADFKEIENFNKLIGDELMNDNIKEYIMKKYEESNR